LRPHLENVTITGMRAVPDVDPDRLVPAVARGRPFVCRRWTTPPGTLEHPHPAWRSHAVQACELSAGQMDVGHSSVWLREHGSTVTMSAADVLRQLDRPAQVSGGLYVFGGRAPEGLAADIRWPPGFCYDGCSHYIASPGARALLHYDSWWAFLVQLHGEKRIVLHPPRDYPYFYTQHGLTHGRSRRASVDIRQPDHARFPLASRRSAGWEVTLGPGDLFFLPARWWHEVEALSASVGVNRRFRAPASACLTAGVAHAYLGLVGRYWFRTSDDLPGRIVAQLLRDGWRALRDGRLRWPRHARPELPAS
jgi:hypothetical protein